MMIRKETFEDHRAVYELNYEAFGNREDESKLIERIRLSKNFIRELSIVAEKAEEIVGHILLSKAKIIGEEAHEVIVLAPVAVKLHIRNKVSEVS